MQRIEDRSIIWTAESSIAAGFLVWCNNPFFQLICMQINSVWSIIVMNWVVSKIIGYLGNYYSRKTRSNYIPNGIESKNVTNCFELDRAKTMNSSLGWNKSVSFKRILQRQISEKFTKNNPLYVWLIGVNFIWYLLHTMQNNYQNCGILLCFFKY